MFIDVSVNYRSEDYTLVLSLERDFFYQIIINKDIHQKMKCRQTSLRTKFYSNLYAFIHIGILLSYMIKLELDELFFSSSTLQLKIYIDEISLKKEIRHFKQRQFSFYTDLDFRIETILI